MGYKRHWMLVPEPQLEEYNDELEKQETWFPEKPGLPMPLDVQGFLFTLLQYQKNRTLNRNPKD